MAGNPAILFLMMPCSLCGRTHGERKMEIDLHGYHPTEIVFNGILGEILRQAWGDG